MLYSIETQNTMSHDQKHPNLVQYVSLSMHTCTSVQKDLLGRFKLMAQVKVSDTHTVDTSTSNSLALHAHITQHWMHVIYAALFTLQYNTLPLPLYYYTLGFAVLIVLSMGFYVWSLSYGEDDPVSHLFTQHCIYLEVLL